MKSFAGICSESPRRGIDGRLGVVGLSEMDVSSLETLAGSRNLGDGDRTGGLPSDRDLPFEGDLLVGSCSSFFPSAALSSAAARIGISLSFAPSIVVVLQRIRCCLCRLKFGQ
jgi:hypothetical protein